MRTIFFLQLVSVTESRFYRLGLRWQSVFCQRETVLESGKDFFVHLGSQFALDSLVWRGVALALNFFRPWIDFSALLTGQFLCILLALQVTDFEAFTGYFDLFLCLELESR